MIKKFTKSIGFATLVMSTLSLTAQNIAPDEDTSNIRVCTPGASNSVRTIGDLPNPVNVGKIDDRSCYSNYSESLVNGVKWGVYNITEGSNHLGTALQPRIERSLPRAKEVGVGSYSRFTGTVRILEVGDATNPNDDGTYMMQSKGKHTGGGGSPDPAICLYLVKPVIGQDANGNDVQVSFKLYREQIKFRGGAGRVGRDFIFLMDIEKNEPLDVSLEVGFRQDPNDPTKRIHYSDAVIGGKVFNWNIPEPERGVESGIRYGAYRIRGGRAQIRWANTTHVKREVVYNPNAVTSTNSAPEVTLTSPLNNATFTLGETINLTASASDANGNLDKVNFQINDAFYKTDNARPFETVFTPTEAGTYKIAARAIDTNNLRTDDYVTITVVGSNQAPDTNITSPTNGAVYELGETITLSASATDIDGNLDMVNFKINDAFYKSDRARPFNTTFTPDAIGDYKIAVRAFDKEGLNIEKSILITVIAPENSNVNIPETTGSCNFNLPSSSPLPTVERKSYTNVYSFGQTNIDIENIRRLRINWDLNSNKLVQFAINTKNGTPSYYVDLTDKTNDKLNTSNPEISISGSGIEGLDGDYYVGLQNNNFILVAKDSAFTIYFSNDSTVPLCSSSNAVSDKLFGAPSDQKTVTLYPNPSFNDVIKINGLSDSSFNMQIFSLSGKLVFTKTIENYQNEKIDLSTLLSGAYIVKIATPEQETVHHLVKQ